MSQTKGQVSISSNHLHRESFSFSLSPPGFEVPKEGTSIDLVKSPSLRKLRFPGSKRGDKFRPRQVTLLAKVALSRFQTRGQVSTSSNNPRRECFLFFLSPALASPLATRSRAISAHASKLLSTQNEEMVLRLCESNS
jgi:hypothetical protein